MSDEEKKEEEGKEEVVKTAPRTVGNSQRYTEVICLDEPHETNKGCHEYTIVPVEKKGAEFEEVQISFQNGPIKEAGVNGIHNEDLLAIVVDRLQGFQNGPFKCHENQVAASKIKEALYNLGKRTERRVARGVEGTNEV